MHFIQSLTEIRKFEKSRIYHQMQILDSLPINHHLHKHLYHQKEFDKRRFETYLNKNKLD